MSSVRPGSRLRSVILSLLFVPLARAEARPTPTITDAMTTPVFRNAGELGALIIPPEFALPAVEGVIQVGQALPTEVASMRLFAKAHPTTFVLTAEVDGLSTPMFDGVVLGEDGRPIANFSLKTLTSEDVLETGKRVLRRMERYSDPAHWSFALRKALLQRIDHPRVDPLEKTVKLWPDVIPIETAERQKIFDRIYGAFRKMNRYFGTGSGRPNWALLDLTALPEISRERISEIAWHLTAGKPGRLALLLNGDRLYTMHAGKWDSRPLSCAAAL